MPPQVAAEVRQRLYRLVFPARETELPDNAERDGRAPDEPGEPGESDRMVGTAGATRPVPTASDSSVGSEQGLSERPRLRRAHLVLVAILLVLALLVAIVVVVRRAPAPEPLPEPSPSLATSPTALDPGVTSPGATAGSEPGAAATPSVSAAGRIIVHVDGKVREPGVVTLPAGSRVVDAIEASGGAKAGADLGTVNLARPLQDGEQVLVDTGQTPAAVGGDVMGTRGASPSAAPIDLNAATLPELEQLPGIGPALGQRILDYRAEHGGFTSVDELHEVSGIGEQRFAELRDRAVVR